MPFHGLPITSTASRFGQAYADLEQFWRAAAERATYGCNKWPAGNFAWSDFNLDGVTDNNDGTLTLACSDKAGATDWTPDDGMRWVDFPDSEIPYLPPNYSVVIYVSQSDPRYIVRGDIISNDDGTLTVNDEHWFLNLTSGDLTDVRGEIIPDYGVSWAERFPDPPNSWTYAYGPVSASTTNSITFNKSWTDDYWTTAHPEKAGAPTAFDVIAFDGSAWHRAQITGSISGTVAFTSQTWTAQVGSDAYIVERDGWWIPEQRFQTSTDDAAPGVNTRVQATAGWHPTQWWYGSLRGVWTHMPNDTLQFLSLLPKLSQVENQGESEGNCEESALTLFPDADPKISLTDECNTTPDRYLQPNVHKSFRMLQADLESMVGGYCLTFSPYDPLDTAKAFELAGNHTVYVEITGTSDGSALCGISMPAVIEGGEPLSAVECSFVLYDADMNRVNGGEGIAEEGVFSCNINFNGSHVGFTLLISFKWDRYFPSRFRHAYPRCYILPNFNEEAALVDPPTEEFPGQWNHRDPSTLSCEWSKFGFLTERAPFVTDQILRYMGDTLINPSTDDTDNPIYPFTPYEDKAFQGKPGIGTGWFVPTKRGVATSGGNFYLTDSAASFTEGEWHVESGTATSGNTLSLTDSTKIGNGYWNAGRFESFDGAYIIFVVEVNDGSGVWHKRMITASNPATGQLTWDVALPFSASGKQWRIIEPKYLLASLESRTLRVTKASDGSVHDVVILTNDKTTFFFATADFTVEAGDGWEIFDEFRPGESLLWDGEKFVRPVGADPRGKDWHENCRENLPTMCHGYGRMRLGDYLQPLFNQLHSFILTMQESRFSVALGGLGVGENNQFSASADEAYAGSGPGITCSHMQGLADADWSHDSASDFAPLMAGSQVYLNSDINTSSLIKQYNYTNVEGLSPCVSKTVEIWAYATINDIDTDQGTTYNPFGVEATYTFDDNGTGLLYRQWAVIASEGVGIGATTLKKKIGNDSKPDWGPCPQSFDPPTYGGASYAGYYVQSLFAIVTWDFEYV